MPPARRSRRDPIAGSSRNPNGDQLREIAGLVDGGAIKPVIDREFAFEQLPAALTYLEAGRARGKVVLRVK